MPTERDAFNLTIKYNGTVLDTETGMQVAEAHELPAHGRLIDGDALCKKLKIMYAKAFRDGNSAYHSAYRSLENIINDAPTVLERSDV